MVHRRKHPASITSGSTRRAGISARTDIAGFVGIATRGPSSGAPVQSWRQFQAYFGDFTGQGYLAYAVRAFFENGGRVLGSARGL